LAPHSLRRGIVDDQTPAGTSVFDRLVLVDGRRVRLGDMTRADLHWVVESLRRGEHVEGADEVSSILEKAAEDAQS
jgi:hypothetical protein